MGLRHSSTCPYHGQSLLCVKKWFEAQISGILPDVSSYISHFVCLYNFNYTGRPLRGPGIIGITNYFQQRAKQVFMTAGITPELCALVQVFCCFFFFR